MAQEIVGTTVDGTEVLVRDTDTGGMSWQPNTGGTNPADYSSGEVPAGGYGTYTSPTPKAPTTTPPKSNVPLLSDSILSALNGAPRGMTLAQVLAYLRQFGFEADDTYLGSFYDYYTKLGALPINPPFQPGVLPPSGGGTTGGGTTMPTDMVMGPYAEYLKARGLGGMAYLNPAQQYQAGLYNPLRSLFETQYSMYGIPGYGGGAQTPDWASFVGQQGGAGRQGIYGGFANALQQLLGATPENRAIGGLTFEPTAYNETTGNPEYEGQGIDWLQNLLAGGLRNRMTSGGASYLASRVPFLQNLWQTQGAPGGTFLDYLRAKYNL